MNRTNDVAPSPGPDDWRLICDLLDSSANRFPDRILFKDGSGRTATYFEAKELVDDLARGLVLEGLAAGDKIGLLGERNSSDWCISYLAILRIGAVVVPLDPSLKAGELATMLGDCEASGIISSGKIVEMLKKIRNDITSLERIVALDRTGSFGVPLIGDLIGKGRGQNIRFPDVDPDSLAILLYTSGTTGKPKGVMLSHSNTISDIRAIHKRLDFSIDDVVLSILPLHHTFECTCGFLNSMSLGSKVVFARSYKSSELVEDMRDNGVTYMCGVPLLYEKMYLSFKRKIAKSPVLKRSLFRTLFSISSYGQKRHWNWGRGLFKSMRDKAGMGSLRMLVSGGAALPIEVSRFFGAIGIPMLQGYGLSETSPVLSVSPIELNKFDSIGPPLDGVEVRIDNPDQHGIGEIVVNGPMVMLGYYKNDAATAAVLRQGWFFTGDVGRVDSDGYMYITGRSKNVIVSAAGKNIYPEEIEDLLNKSPYILESLVLGRKAPSSNVEDVTAVIVPDHDAMTTAEQRSVEDIIQGEVTSVCSRLADFKRIKKYYIRDEEFPKTSTRKIKRCLEIDGSGNLFEKKKV
jgi:long-chain acyl-CoA synthetase